MPLYEPDIPSLAGPIPSQYKPPCRAATTADISLSGEQTIDGVALVVGDRVLVKDQNTPSQNGIYLVAAGFWTRADDSNVSSEVRAGLVTVVEQGNINGGKIFLLTTPNPIVLGTTALTLGAAAVIFSAKNHWERLAAAKLGVAGHELISKFYDFSPAVAGASPHQDTELATNTPGTAPLDVVHGSLLLRTGAGSGFAIINSLTGANGAAIPNQQSSKYFIGARVRTATPGTFDANSTFLLGFSDGTTQFGIGLHGSQSASLWRLWRANGGAFTHQDSTPSTKTTTDTQNYVDVYCYSNALAVRASVDGEPEITAPFLPSALANAVGQWRAICLRLGGTGLDVLGIESIFFARARGTL